MSYIELEFPSEDKTSGGGGGDFELLPDGLYKARVFDVKLEKPDNGKSYFEVTFKIQEGDFEGRRLWKRYYLTKAAMWSFQKLVKATTGSVLKGSQNFKVGSLIGKPLELEVGTSEYNGKERNEVASERSSGGAASSPQEGVTYYDEDGEEEPDFGG